MFVCFDCDAIFEEPATRYENHGEYFGKPAREAYGACPCCGSTEYDAMVKCDRCGEWTATPHYENIVLCDICFDDLYGGL